MSSCDLEFSAFPQIVSVNPGTNIFIQKILKGYMPQKVEKIIQNHLQIKIT